MFASQKRSIKTKLAAVAFIGVMSAMLLAGSVAVWRAAEYRYSGIKQELGDVATTLAIAVSPALSQKQYHQAQNILRAIGRMPRINFARVVDTDGSLIAAFGNGVVLQREAALVESNKAIPLLTALRLRTYPVRAPIISGGQQIGTLNLIADVSELRNTVFESIAAALLWGVIAGGIGILAALRMGATLTDPILNLTKAMREVRERHDYAAQVQRTSNDETGDLVDAFNNMLHEIRTRDRALQRHRETLEQTVDERTSELRIATKEAQEANAAKSDFLATMSHEIRTPMNGMLVMAELLTASGLSPRLQRYADVIVTSGKSLLSIINDILDFSKIEAGKMELESIPVEPRKLVDEVTRLFAQRAASEGLDLAGFVASDVPETIAADPVRLNQVISNLVNNALKFTETGGVSVRILSEPIPGHAGQRQLRFEVIDTGIGIPADRVNKVFDAFAQADQTTTRKFGGTGIGLAICQRLADAMGGEMSVTSELGEGSTFALTAPFEVLQSAEQLQEETNEAPQNLALVMPQGPSRECLRGYAEENGFRVDEHEDAAAAIAAGREPATVVLVSGYEAEIIRTSFPTAKSIVLAGLPTAEPTPSKRGSADATISWPLVSDEIKALFAALRAGDLSSLEDNSKDAVAQKSFRQFPGVRILAADDSAINQEVLREALSRLDVTIVSVEDGQAAVEAVKQDDFDLVFMDGSMPVMDGYEATKVIRTWEAEMGREAMPIVALTAHVIGSQAALWREAGMDDCVTKPFKLATLEKCLEQWLPEHVAENATVAPQDAQAAASDSQQGSSFKGESSAPVLLDPEVMDQIREMQSGDMDLAARIISLYREHAPKALAVMREAWPKASDDEIGKAAHALKSLSRNIGAVRVGDICDVIETSSREGTLDRDKPHLSDLDIALSATLAALPDPSSDVDEVNAAPKVA